MKKIILLICSIFFLFMNIKAQEILYTKTIDISVIGADNDSVFYFASNEDYNCIGFEFELINIARNNDDSIKVDIGCSNSQTGFNQFNSEKFPYEVNPSDSSVSNSSYYLRRFDFADVNVSLYIAIQVINEAANPIGSLTIKITGRKESRYYIITR